MLEKDGEIVKLKAQNFKLKLKRQDRRLLKHDCKRKYQKIRDKICKELETELFSETSETDDC